MTSPRWSATSCAPTPTLRFDTSKPDGTPRKVLDVTKLNDLGWTAKTDLETGIRSTYQWFLDQQAANVDLRGIDSVSRCPADVQPRRATTHDGMLCSRTTQGTPSRPNSPPPSPRRGEAITYTYCAAALSPKGFAEGNLDVVRRSRRDGLREVPASAVGSGRRSGTDLRSSRVVWSRPTGHPRGLQHAAGIGGDRVDRCRCHCGSGSWSGSRTCSPGSQPKSLGGGWKSRAFSSTRDVRTHDAQRTSSRSHPSSLTEATRRGVAARRVSVMENWAPIEKLPMLAPRDGLAKRDGAPSRTTLRVLGDTRSQARPIAARRPRQMYRERRRARGGGDRGRRCRVPHRSNPDAVQHHRTSPCSPTNRSTGFRRFWRAPTSSSCSWNPRQVEFSVPSKTLSYLCAGRASARVDAVDAMPLPSCSRLGPTPVWSPSLAIATGSARSLRNSPRTPSSETSSAATDANSRRRTSPRTLW